MNRSPIVLIILAGLLVLCLLSAVSFIRSGQVRATTEASEPGGELGEGIPFTGQSGQTQTPEDEQPPSAGQPPAGETPAGGDSPSPTATRRAARLVFTPQGTPNAAQAAPTLRPSRTPEPTNTPIPTFTRMPALSAATATPGGAGDSGPSAGQDSTPQAGSPAGAAPTAVDEQAYRSAVTRQVAACNEALADFDEFARAVTADPTTLFDPNIRTRLDESLEEIDGTCGFLGTIDPVPPQYSVADQTFDRAAEEYNEMTDAFRRGVDTLNPTLLVEALDHLEAATALANQAQQQMP